MHSPSGNGHATEKVGKPTSNGGRATLPTPVSQPNSYEQVAEPRGVKTRHNDRGTDIDILHLNIQGFCGHAAELSAYIQLLKTSPSIICLNETFLDKSTPEVELHGYVLAARRDRQDGQDYRKCGGVMVFTKADIANNVTLLESSREAERLWLVVHTDHGPYLLCAWYRPPVPGEVETIRSFEKEWHAHCASALGTVLVGDLNLHHLRWLRDSSRNSSEGELMQTFCNQYGFRQLVSKPTRGNYKLDLLVTDIPNLGCTVTASIADHKGVLGRLKLRMPKTEIVCRRVWVFSQANWSGLQERFNGVSWDFISKLSVDDAAATLTKTILDCASDFIPERTLRERKSTHPWINDHVLHLIVSKHQAEGTDTEKMARDACSQGILAEFGKYVQSERQDLTKMQRGSKAWWGKSRRLLQQKSRICSIPALRDKHNNWVLDAAGKANLFATTLSAKYHLSEAKQNNYTSIDVVPFREQRRVHIVTTAAAAKVLHGLREDSGTGPDRLPARILKQCANALAEPICRLTRRILESGRWPAVWIVHWVVPLFKKLNVYNARNYRGVHLTSQLSKVVERLLKTLYAPHVAATLSFGPNQFAYTKGRGARDVLALVTLIWIRALARGEKIGVYCSDVAGAFDRVEAERLIAKLRAKKLHPDIVAVMASWLRQRSAHIIVGGKQSEEMTLQNMVFQGTVIGPDLWNCFFEDARHAINEWLFTEVAYADDHNAYRVFGESSENADVMKSIDHCQKELHNWGDANQVAFDPDKESKHILSLATPFGKPFKLLGLIFDMQLDMTEATCEVVREVGWKLRNLLRTRRYYCDADLVILYKAHILSFLEFRTPAIYHARREALSKLDKVQTRFLSDAGIDEVTALMHFNLAPLRMRRDISMLGVLHRAALGKGPPQLRELFKRKPGSFMLVDPYNGATLHPLTKRSAWGLIGVYNRLGSGAQSITDVKNFQFYLQERVKELIRKQLVGKEWDSTYSPR